MNRRLGALKSVRAMWNNDEFSLPGVELKIVQSLLLPFISVAWGRQLRLGEMRFHPQWNIVLRYPDASIHFTSASVKKYVSLIFGDLFQANR
jgi:hypothetical protein